MQKQNQQLAQKTNLELNNNELLKLKLTDLIDKFGPN